MSAPRMKPDFTGVRTEELLAEINRRLAEAAGEPEEAKGYVAHRPAMMPEAWAADHAELWGQMRGEVEIACRHAAEAHRHGEAGYGSGLVGRALEMAVFHAGRAQVCLPKLAKIEEAARKDEARRMLAEFRELERQYRRGAK